MQMEGGHREESVNRGKLIHLLEQAGVGHREISRKGEMLFWQGDPVDDIYVIVSGAVKVFSVSPEGKTYTFGFAGPGDILGASEFLLAKEYDSMAEAAEDTDVIAIAAIDFEQQVSLNPTLAPIVMRNLAERVRTMTSQVRGLGFLDVQQRLKQRLIDLAQEYGIPTSEGIRIDLNITHEEIGELVAANRVTITAYLNEFKRRGYLWKDGRSLVIMAPEHMEILDHLTQAVVDGDEDGVVAWAQNAISARVEPVRVFDALASGMREIDRLLIHKEIDVSDIILSAYAMKRGLTCLKESVQFPGTHIGNLGTIVIGTVRGDIHDIGHTMVAMLMTARGFNVIDLGIDVSTEQFIAAVKAFHPDILAMSSLMTTTALEQQIVIEALKAEGLNTQMMVLIGGSAVTQKYSQEIGATGFAPNAQRAVELAYRLIRKGREKKKKPGLDPQ
jgi:5-methyltetrahydrofolate--homocysteine methyltransferase